MIDTSHRSASSPGPTPFPTQLSAPVSTSPSVDRSAQAEPAAHPFAEMLRQQRQGATPRPASADRAGSTSPAAQPSPASSSSTSTSAATADAASSAATTNPAGRDAGQAKARNSAATRATAHHDATAADAGAADGSTGASAKTDAREVDAREARTSDANASTANGTTPPAPSPAVAAGLLPAPGGAAPASGLTDDGATASPAADAAVQRTLADAQGGLGSSDDDGAASGAMTAGVGAERRSIRLEADAVGVDKGAVAGASADTRASTPFAAVLADTKDLHSAIAVERGTRDGAPATAPLGDASMQPASPPAAATATASASVATPVDAPDFAAAFGMQVSVLAKDGVQQAELHLNPADMGPVSIHITLDGTLAHVDFGADVAATRHAIEAGLPELASALRDAGFTLAGGGVAQHSASHDGGREDTPSSRAGGVSARAGRSAVGALDASAQRQVNRQVQRAAAGGVDLFA